MSNTSKEEQFNSLEFDAEVNAVCEFLKDIEDHFKYKTLLHAQKSVIRENLYIPIQVTLERKYRHEVETFWGYAESEAEIKRAYALKQDYILKGINLELQRPQVSWEEAKKHHQRIMVLADPGMGKSALLRREARLTAETERQKLLAREKTIDDIIFPLFIRLADLDETDEAIAEAVPNLIQRDYPKTWEKIAHRLTGKLMAGQCVLLLNALDEVPKSKRNRLSERINQFANNYPCPIICTSRIVGYGGHFLDSAKEVEIVPLSQKQMEQYIEAWFTYALSSPNNISVSAQGLIRELHTKPQIRGLAHNPRLLYLLCSLYQEKNLTLPERRCQIYEKTVNCILHQWSRSQTPKAETRIQAKIQLLEELAYQFSSEGEEIFDSSQILRKLADYLASDRAPSEFKNDTPENLLVELSQEDGIIQKLAKEADRYVFIHRITQDYLTASYLKRAIAENPNQGIVLAKNHFWDYDWHQPLSLLAGLMDDPIPLLQAITHEKDDIFSTLLLLAGRCIAECEENSHSLITEIIDKIYKLWVSYPFVGFIESVIVALGQANSQLLQKLQTALEQKHYYNRKETVAAVVVALGQIGSPQAVELLIHALNHAPWYVRGEAAEALGRIGTPEAIKALMKALHDEDNYVRGDAAEALGRIGDPQVVEALMKALHDSDSYVRGMAAIALGQIGSPQALDGLIKVLNHEDRFVRWEATGACHIGSPLVVEVLTKALEQSDRQIKEEATVILGRIGSPEAVEALIPALHDFDKSVREQAATALGRISSPEALQALIPALHDSDRYVREQAAAALGRVGNPQVVEALIPSLHHEDSTIRKHTVEALGQIGGSQAIEALIKALRDPDELVRKHAVDSLGQIGGSKVVEVLIPVLHDPDGGVREQAAVALSQIGTEDTLARLLQLPKSDLYRTDIFALTRSLAVRFSKAGTPLIPVYPELIGQFGFIHQHWRRLLARKQGRA